MRIDDIFTNLHFLQLSKLIKDSSRQAAEIALAIAVQPSAPI